MTGREKLFIKCPHCKKMVYVLLDTKLVVTYEEGEQPTYKGEQKP